jgi:hypothetical protein
MQLRVGNRRRASVVASASQVNGSNVTVKQLVSRNGPHLPRWLMIPLIPALTAGSDDLEHDCAETQARDIVSVEIMMHSTV